MPLGRGGGVTLFIFALIRDPHLHLRSHGKIGDCEQSTSMSTIENSY